MEQLACRRSDTHAGRQQFLHTLVQAGVYRKPLGSALSLRFLNVLRLTLPALLINLLGDVKI